MIGTKSKNRALDVLFPQYERTRLELLFWTFSLNECVILSFIPETYLENQKCDKTFAQHLGNRWKTDFLGLTVVSERQKESTRAREKGAEGGGEGEEGRGEGEEGRGERKK